MPGLLHNKNEQNPTVPFPKRRTDDFLPIILIVEDDTDSRLMLKLLLEMWHYRVLEATNGAEAVGFAAKETLALILMDIKMPELDGFETTHRIRQSAKAQDVPIVFVSGYAEEIYRRAAFAAGGSEYLVKPLDFEKLEKILNRYVYKGIVAQP